jgi:hypothetical protein
MWVCKSAQVSQNCPMRNPDKWSPMEPEEPDPPHVPKLLDQDGGSGSPNTRRGALVGLVIILLLVAGGLMLTRVLHHMSQLQDCALSGRSNCR